MLVSEQLDENETQLPSPEQLKRRIILKGKTLPKDSQRGRFSSEDSSDGDAAEATALSQMKKTGKLYLQNPAGLWEPYFFALTDNKLSYIEIAKERNDHDKPDSAVHNAIT